MNPAKIVDMASSFHESCVLFAASDLGLFAGLARLGPSDAGTVARACGLNERGAGLLLDACVAVGLLKKQGSLYENTPESAVCLVPGAAADLSSAIRYNRDVYAAWGRLADLARTGRPVERPEIHLGEDAKRTRAFVLAMHGRALGIGRAVVPGLNLVGVNNILDVGGGPGTYSVLMAQTSPGIRCTVMDLPAVVSVAGELIREAGMEKQVRTVAGDYRTAAFPGGNDRVVFFGVLHQESPDSIRALMRKAWDSLTPGGEVYVMDMMTDATHTRPRFSTLFAVNMALTTENGWVFSDDELRGWMTGAGFKSFTCRPLAPPMPHWLASAVKPE